MNAGELHLAGAYQPHLLPRFDNARPTDESACLTMEERDLDALCRRLSECGVDLRSWASRRIRRTHSDGIVQILLVWTDERWEKGTVFEKALRQALSEVAAPYQLVVLGEDIGDVEHVYGHGFENTDMDGVTVLHTWCW